MSTVIHLGALNFGGFTILGADPGDGVGFDVSSAGDINKDGYDDIIIGVPQDDDAGRDSGSAYVIFGKASGFATIDLTNLQPANGFVIRGDVSYDQAGRSVSSAGDVNGDGFEDIIVGAPFGDNASENAGEAYVIYGKASGFGAVDLTALAAGSGFVIQGPAPQNAAGYGVSSAGDINGDGFDDLIVTSRVLNSGGWGYYYYAYDTTPSAYVVFGKANPAAAINLSTLSAADGFKVTSTSSSGWSNFSIAAAGDINGDGLDDIILGDRYGAGGAGEAYVIFGKTTGFTNIDTGALALPDGFKIQGGTFDWAGFSVAGAGDVNDDGFDDIVIGASLDDGGAENAGAAYVVFGKNTGFGTIDLTNLAVGAGFEIRGEATFDSTGYSVSGAGDVNGDGFADIIISAPFSNFGAGRAYVIFGKETGFETINLSNLPPSAGFKIQGDITFAHAGFSVSGAGDINDDGFDDLLIGAPGNPAGAVLVIFGRAKFIQDVRNDFNGDGRSDVLWRHDNGVLSNWLGRADGGFVANDSVALVGVPTNWQVAGTGDFNGDGRDDILWRANSGQVSDWLGTASGGWQINDANAFVGVPSNWKIMGEGDFNGDGRDDILWRNDNGQLSNWLGQANGGFAINDANAFASVSTSWKIAGVGDFNGDGRDDILWRSDAGMLSDWLGRASGGWQNNDANALAGTPSNWKIIGTGDFNGDDRDDILWRSDTGALSNWLGQAHGGFVANDVNAFTNVALMWHVAQIGDFNGDGRDDILWRSDAGGFSNWLGTASGGFAANDARALTQVETTWVVQVPTDVLI